MTNRGRSRFRGGSRLLGLAAVIVLATSGPAAAATQDISSPGPVDHIYLGDDLTCQAHYGGDQANSFFGGVPGSCGTRLRVSGSDSFLTPTNQSGVTGSGTQSDPFNVVTTVAADGESLTITRTDSYVVGDDFYRSDVTVANSAGADQAALLWHWADCFLQDSDQGYGTFDPATGGIYCSANPHNVPPARIEGFVPLSGGAQWFEGPYGEASSPSPGGFPNTCMCDVLLDNGMALSWDIVVAANGSTTRSFLTTFSPTGAVFRDPRPATLEDLPNPELGVDVNVEQVAGIVMVGVPTAAARAAGSGARARRASRSCRCSEARQVPVGSFLDTRRGTVRLESAREPRRHSARRGTSSTRSSRCASRASGARKGLTDLVLKGGSFRRCRAGGGKGSPARRSAAADPAAARATPRDASAPAAATARRPCAAPIWDVIDRCDGTLTRVRRGSVVVRDFRRKRNIVVRAGKSYLAKRAALAEPSRGRAAALGVAEAGEDVRLDVERGDRQLGEHASRAPCRPSRRGRRRGGRGARALRSRLPARRSGTTSIVCGT